MNRNYLIGGLVVVIVVALGIGFALYTGLGPAPGGDSGDELSEFPTETGPSEGDDADGGTASDGGTAVSDSTSVPPFTFAIDEIEECGTTCRDVTATLTNNRDETATGVTVYTRIFAGEDNTDENDIVWEGEEDVGSLEADGTHTSTRRVELSLQEARAIDQEDGWITIVTTVQGDDRTVTFQNSEQVA